MKLKISMELDQARNSPSDKSDVLVKEKVSLGFRSIYNNQKVFLRVEHVAAQNVMGWIGGVQRKFFMWNNISDLWNQHYSKYNLFMNTKLHE